MIRILAFVLFVLALAAGVGALLSSAAFADGLQGKVIGFSLAVLHEGSWVRTPICYLEDLYVAEAQRGKGVGRALVADLIDLGQRSGWSRLYWHTREANAAARRLYESITPASGFIVYRVDL